MRNLIHKAFCSVGWHRFTPWVETKYDPKPPPGASHMEKLIYLTEGYLSRQRHCALCGYKEELKKKLFP
jgi:hypothetical protein